MGLFSKRNDEERIFIEGLLEGLEIAAQTVGTVKEQESGATWSMQLQRIAAEIRTKAWIYREHLKTLR